MSLLTTENLEDAQKLILEYPWLQEIYEEIAMLRQKPEEVLGMFSEALKILVLSFVPRGISQIPVQARHLAYSRENKGKGHHISFIVSVTAISRIRFAGK